MADGRMSEEGRQVLKGSGSLDEREDPGGHRTGHKMRVSFHLGASQLALLSLALLCPIPRTITSYPLTSLLPTVDGPDLESALLHLQAALEDPHDDDLAHPEAWEGLRPTEEMGGEEEDGSLEEEALLRAQRGDLMAQPLSPFPGGHSLESVHYQEGGEGEDGRNNALTSIAGGLQAVSREKGGFGFRFGRKRWTERGWRDERVRGGERRTSGS